MRDPVLALWLAPCAALVAAPVGGTTYFTIEQAQAALFPGAQMTARTVALRFGVDARLQIIARRV